MKADKKAEKKALKKALKKTEKTELKIEKTELKTESESEKSDSDSTLKTDKPKTTKINQMAKLGLFLTELQKKNPSNTDTLYAEIMKEIGFTSRAIPSKWGGKKERKSGNRSKTAYNFFVGSESVRNEIKEKYENMPVSKTMKIIGEMWKNLSEEEKQKYVDMATEDRKNFPNSEKSEREEKSANGYQMYASEHRESIRAKNPTVGGREITKLISIEWKKLDDDAKSVYLNKATEMNSNNPKIKTKKMSKTDSAKNDEDHILNPETNRMVAKNSKLGKALMQKARESKKVVEKTDSDSDSDSEPETPMKMSKATEAPKAPKKANVPKKVEQEPLFDLEGSDSDSDSDSEVEVAMQRKKKIAMKAKQVKHVLTDSESDANDSTSEDESEDESENEDE